MPRIFVLTGGPCTGKTATLEALRKRGCIVSGEAARKVIEREMNKGSDALPWKDRDAFQRSVLDEQKELEAGLRGEKDAFLDRGIPDGLVYYRLDGLEPPKELLEAARETRYDRVFVLDILPEYETDESRREDPETMRKIHMLVKDVYRELGYEIVEVPVMSVEKRVDFILDRV